MNLWTVSKLTQLPFELRRKIRFYAPLLESLDFMGVDPVTFSRASASSALHRDGSNRTVAAHVPRFEYGDDLPLGLLLSSGETLQFAAANELHSIDTLIWFEDLVPKSTPTNTRPFNSSGIWTGNLDIHAKHILGASPTLTIAEINRIQLVLEDVEQVIEEPDPIIPVTGQFYYQELTVTGNTAPLDFEPVLASLNVWAHGSNLYRKPSGTPAEREYTATGTGNQTITFGLDPAPNSPVFAQYVLA